MPAIRRQVNIAAAQRAVWNALTTAEGLTSWWADEARIEPRAGGRVVIGNKNGQDQVTEDRGFIHTWRPTSRLEIAFDNVGTSELKGTRLSFSLARDGDETLVAMVHAGGDALEDEARRQALDDEWKRAFKALQTHLDQEPSSPFFLPSSFSRAARATRGDERISPEKRRVRAEGAAQLAEMIHLRELHRTARRRKPGTAAPHPRTAALLAETERISPDECRVRAREAAAQLGEMIHLRGLRRTARP